jgi:hypothetical protein
MSAGAVAFSSILLTSAVIAAQCRSNALSKTLRAVFFSVADHVISSLNGSRDSIDNVSLRIKCSRVEANHDDHNPLEFPLQPEKRPENSMESGNNTTSALNNVSLMARQHLPLKCFLEGLVRS